ncbi:MAG: hypothetical protein FD139_2938 [Methylocystaceae bacterium]|nr:MAG: hypothetical protein FD148_1287 [Methylocystaceae bacterium]KAF0209249.1 MAG: hypothetical protein FD172_3383 [Methylocystaceae bacterium]TXT43453.1 MAG: hypothetical protein FD139_2938 [Methylocystaceae bacterium]
MSETTKLNLSEAVSTDRWRSQMVSRRVARRFKSGRSPRPVALD